MWKIAFSLLYKVYGTHNRHMIIIIIIIIIIITHQVGKKIEFK